MCWCPNSLSCVYGSCRACMIFSQVMGCLAAVIGWLSICCDCCLYGFGVRIVESFKTFGGFCEG